MDAREVLSQRIGPYPAGAWLALIGGGTALGLVLRRRFSSGPTTTVLPDTTDEAGNPVNNAIPGALGRPTVGSSSAGTSSTVAEPTNNQEWTVAAIRYLVGAGTDPAQAQGAITRFVDGTAITLAEQALVGNAIRALGPPPEYVPAIITAPTQAPAATPGFQAAPTPGKPTCTDNIQSGWYGLVPRCTPLVKASVYGSSPPPAPAPTPEPAGRVSPVFP